MNLLTLYVCVYDLSPVSIQTQRTQHKRLRLDGNQDSAFDLFGNFDGHLTYLFIYLFI